MSLKITALSMFMFMFMFKAMFKAMLKTMFLFLSKLAAVDIIIIDVECSDANSSTASYFDHDVTFFRKGEYEFIIIVFAIVFVVARLLLVADYSTATATAAAAQL